MARLLTNSGNQSEETTTSASLGSSGGTLTNGGKITATSFNVRECTTDSVGVKQYGAPITGKNAVDIVTTYNIETADKKLSKFREQCEALKRRTGIVAITRSLAADQTVEERSKAYMVGQILGYMNTCPSRFTVAGRTYIYEKTSVTKYLTGEEVMSILIGEAYIGAKDKPSVELKDEEDRTNVFCINQSMLEEAGRIFKEVLSPNLRGNTLYYGDVAIVTFAETKIQDKIAVSANSLDLEKIELF